MEKILATPWCWTPNKYFTWKKKFEKGVDRIKVAHYQTSTYKVKGYNLRAKAWRQCNITKKNFRTTKSICISLCKKIVYFSRKVYFLYFAYLLFKTPHIRISILHYISLKCQFFLIFLIVFLSLHTTTTIYSLPLSMMSTPGLNRVEKSLFAGLRSITRCGDAPMHTGTPLKVPLSLSKWCEYAHV